jgi:prephenate dehydratase
MPVSSSAVRIAFLGPEGTFTEEALLTQPDLAGEELVPIGDIVSVIAAVAAGDVDMGIVPVENSIEGAVTATLDTLAFDFPSLRVRREITLPIELDLMAAPATALSEIKEVRSKAEAAAQCRGFLACHLPGARVVAWPSTAEAARSVASEPGAAAIGTALAAKLYGLEVLNAHIEDHPENTTRFWLLGHGIPRPTGHDKTTLVLFQTVDRPGGLIAILQEFAARAINLTKLESRPTKRGLGRYCFFIDCAGHVSDELLADCLRNLSAKVADVTFLGSYPAAGDGGEEIREAATDAWAKAVGVVDEWRGEIDP